MYKGGGGGCEGYDFRGVCLLLAPVTGPVSRPVQGLVGAGLRGRGAPSHDRDTPRQDRGYPPQDTRASEAMPRAVRFLL